MLNAMQFETIDITIKCNRANIKHLGKRTFKNLFPVSCDFEQFLIGEVKYDEGHDLTSVILGYIYEDIIDIDMYNILGYEWISKTHLRVTIAKIARPRSE